MTDLQTRPSSVALLAALEEVGGVIDQCLYLPPDIPYERYESIGALLGHHHDMVNWLLGDWLIYGEHTYGEKFAQASAITGLAPQSLMNIQRVAIKIPPQRRRLTVKHSHHEVVAKLPPNDQRRLLKRAEMERLTRSDLRRIVYEEENGADPKYQDVSQDICEACGQRIP